MPIKTIFSLLISFVSSFSVFLCCIQKFPVFCPVHNIPHENIQADLVIQKRENRLLHEIISEEGLDGFLKAEENANVYIAQNEEKSIVATGGSVVYCEKAMQELKKTGRVIYLELEYDQLKKRLGNLKGRGVVLKDGQDLRGLYEERIPLYEKYADLTVNEKNLDVEQTLQKIVDRLSL